MWVPPASAEQATHLSTVLDVIDKVAKILAVIIGACWAYVNYIRGRTFKRRLEPSISGKMIQTEGAVLLSGLAQVKNVGLSKVLIQQKGTAIEILCHTLESADGGPPRLAHKSVAVREVFKVHGWIEPGEQIEESFLMLIPEDNDTVALGLRLRIVSEHIEWNADSIVEIISPKSLQPEDALFRPAYSVVCQNTESGQSTRDIENKKHHSEV